MTLTIAPLTQANALRIANEWHYPAPYDFYDAAADAEDYAELIDPVARGDQYFQVTDADTRLIGFFALAATDDPTVTELGLGMAPNLTGHGGGQDFLRQVLTAVQALTNAQTVLLDVAAFNIRAQKVYQKAGFVAVRTHDQLTNGGHYKFIEMRGPARPPQV
ncbi:GNAT family N-acetyltransferase [Lacticaseibacillus parakribbianus]|uniref:GNAT family N-acetyltransferase n=1 Tax=Lacticaseibacillus parakribbianus TaxID=2970927 RepID=UPI0021CB30BA